MVSALGLDSQARSVSGPWVQTREVHAPLRPLPLHSYFVSSPRSLIMSLLQTRCGLPSKSPPVGEAHKKARIAHLGSLFRVLSFEGVHIQTGTSGQKVHIRTGLSRSVWQGSTPNHTSHGFTPFFCNPLPFSTVLYSILQRLTPLHSTSLQQQTTFHSCPLPYADPLHSNPSSLLGHFLGYFPKKTWNVSYDRSSNYKITILNWALLTPGNHTCRRRRSPSSCQGSCPSAPPHFLDQIIGRLSWITRMGSN